MRRRLLIVPVLALAALAVMGPSRDVWAAAAPGTPPAAQAPTQSTPAQSTPAGSAPAQPGPAPGGSTRPAAPAGSAPGALTRTERAILLVTLTFLVGAGLLGPRDEEREAGERRPAVTLYDDPTRMAPATTRRRPPGEPPPLR